jgi:hypothetical protein
MQQAAQRCSRFAELHRRCAMNFSTWGPLEWIAAAIIAGGVAYFVPTLAPLFGVP